jgi:hypothetical protein
LLPRAAFFAGEGDFLWPALQHFLAESRTIDGRERLIRIAAAIIVPIRLFKQPDVSNSARHWSAFPRRLAPE